MRFGGFSLLKKFQLRGTTVAMYIVGQERRLVDPPSQVVAGVRTVTTKMNGRDTLPRCRAHSLLVLTLRIPSRSPHALVANHAEHFLY